MAYSIYLNNFIKCVLLKQGFIALNFLELYKLILLALAFRFCLTTEFLNTNHGRQLLNHHFFKTWLPAWVPDDQQPRAIICDVVHTGHFDSSQLPPAGAQAPSLPPLRPRHL